MYSQADVYKQGAWTLRWRPLFSCRGIEFLQRGVADTRSKIRPSMMIVEMTTAEQQYFCHDDNTVSRLAPLTPVMPTGNPSSIKIVEGGYCSDTGYEAKLQEKEAQHEALEKAVKDYGYSVNHTAYNHRTVWITISSYILRSSTDL